MHKLSRAQGNSKDQNKDSESSIPNYCITVNIYDNYIINEHYNYNISNKGLFEQWDTYLLTPWRRDLLEKLTDFAANQEIPRILWNNPEVHYRTHKRPPPIPILS